MLGVILRLSTVLVCSVEELLVPDDFPGDPLAPGHTVDVATIQSQRFCCDKYQTADRWICSSGKAVSFLCLAFFMALRYDPKGRFLLQIGVSYVRM